jgi:hypothetical protein
MPSQNFMIAPDIGLPMMPHSAMDAMKNELMRPRRADGNHFVKKYSAPGTNPASSAPIRKRSR